MEEDREKTNLARNRECQKKLNMQNRWSSDRFQFFDLLFLLAYYTHYTHNLRRKNLANLIPIGNFEFFSAVAVFW